MAENGGFAVQVDPDVEHFAKLPGETIQAKIESAVKQYK